MTYQIVFFDIDGTILKKDGTIDASTTESISALQEKGIEVVLATGRNYKNTMEIAKQIGVDSVISYNGSYVQYKGKELYKHTISPAHVQAFLKEVRIKNGAAACYSLNKEHYTDIQHPVVQLANDVHLTKQPLENHELASLKDVYGMVLYAHSPEEVAHYQRCFPDLHFARWNTLHHCCDVVPHNGSKAKGIDCLLQHLGIPKEQAIAFGDGDNDKEMLSYVGLGIAMGNASASLLPYADKQTEDVENEGVYHALKTIGLVK